MKISCINNANINFGARYKAEDVLMLVTNYPYKGRDTDKIVKSLSGIDMYSDEFRRSIDPSAANAVVTFALEDICADKVMEQEPKLKEVRESYTVDISASMDKEKKENWFKNQLNKFGKTIKLEPFTVTTEEIKKRYKEWLELIDYVQQQIWEMERKGR
jgi:hypothetical protein